MGKRSLKEKLRIRRKIRIRKNLFGSYTIPRITIFRSIKNVNIQAINDYKGQTIASLSTVSRHIKYLMTNKNKQEQAYLLGQYFGKVIYRKGITRAVCDRNGFSYTGR